MSNFTKGATYRTAAAQPDMSTRVIEPAAPAFIPLPSDAPAETIARLSVELAASKAQVARTREALGKVPDLIEAVGDAITEDEYAARQAAKRVEELQTMCAAALSSAPDHIAIPRERYDRMVKALGMGRELAQAAALSEYSDGNARSQRDEILAAMDAAGKA